MAKIGVYKTTVPAEQLAKLHTFVDALEATPAGEEKEKLRTSA